MLVQLNTDQHIDGRADLASWVEGEVSETLERYGEQIVRVEVFFTDENSHKSGALDKKCTVEARLAGMEPVVATDQAGNLDQALEGALDKLLVALERKVGRISDRKGRTSFGGDQTI